MRRSGVLAVLAGVVLLAGVLPAAARADAPIAASDLRSFGIRSVVVLNTGADPGAVAAAADLVPYRMFAGAVTGFGAVLSNAAQRKLAADPRVAMTSPDRPFQGPHAAVASRAATTADAPPVYPPITSYPSFVPIEELRVGVPAAAAQQRLRVRTPVAVVDSGVQLNNPDLTVVGGVNCSDEPGGYGDDYGHGTEVSGVLAAKDNAFGTVGVAPGAPVYSVKVLDSNNSGEDSNIICGINWIAAHRSEVRLANMSLGEAESFATDTHDCGRSAHDAVHLAVCAATRAGVIFVTATGNDAANDDHYSPAGYPEVITASGLSDTDGKRGGNGAECDGNADDVFAQFSNYGRNVTVAAVATCIATDYNDGTLIYDDGTSFAAPAVAGAAAILLDFIPGLTTRDIKTLLRATAEHDNSLVGDPIRPHEGVLNVSLFWRLLEAVGPRQVEALTRAIRVDSSIFGSGPALP